MTDRVQSPVEQLYAILENIVRYDLSDIKNDLVRDNIIDARNIASKAFDAEIRAKTNPAVAEECEHA